MKTEQEVRDTITNGLIRHIEVRGDKGYLVDTIPHMILSPIEVQDLAVIIGKALGIIDTCDRRMLTEHFISQINHFLAENMTKNIQVKGIGKKKSYYVSGGVLTDLRAYINDNFELNVKDLRGIE